jgi:hypothetical protein
MREDSTRVMTESRDVEWISHDGVLNYSAMASFFTGSAGSLNHTQRWILIPTLIWYQICWRNRSWIQRFRFHQWRLLFSSTVYYALWIGWVECIAVMLRWCYELFPEQFLPSQDLSARLRSTVETLIMTSSDESSNICAYFSLWRLSSRWHIGFIAIALLSWQYASTAQKGNLITSDSTSQHAVASLDVAQVSFQSLVHLSEVSSCVCGWIIACSTAIRRVLGPASFEIYHPTSSLLRDN